MTKFHINKHGVPAPCRAKKGNCPLGGADGQENHFDTVEEAQEAADRIMEESYGLLNNLNSNNKRSTQLESVQMIKDESEIHKFDSKDEVELKNKMKEGLNSISNFEKKHGISAERILSRKANDIWENIPEKEVSIVKDEVSKLEKTHERLGKIYSRSEDLERGKKERRIFESKFVKDKIEQEKKEMETLKKMNTDGAKKEMATKKESLDKLQKEFDGLMNEASKAEEKEKYFASKRKEFSDYYSEENTFKRNVDRMYLSEEDTKDFRSRQGALYKFAQNEHSDTIAYNIDSLVKEVNSMARTPQGQEDFWKNNPHLTHPVAEYESLLVLRNADREDVEEFYRRAERLRDGARKQFSR